MNNLEEAKNVFDIEIAGLESVKNSLAENFNQILNAVVECKGKVIVTAIGKSGFVGRKIASTLASLGTPAIFLHPTEALHGDLGIIGKEDIVIAISNSGESEEITRIIPNVKLIGALLIGISGNPNSTLIKYSDYVQVLPKIKEACFLSLAPTTSATSALVYGDALAVVASKMRGFSASQYSLYHPSGALGKKLITKVKDIMKVETDNSIISVGETLKNAIVEMNQKGLGMVNVVNEKFEIIGIITDGDLRRQLDTGVDVYSLTVDEVMTKKPIVIDQELLAVEALKIMTQKNISCLPVVDKIIILVGTIRLKDILDKGIIV